MGSMVSCISSPAAAAATAKVITLGGVVVECNSPIRVSDIICGSESSFVCDSDKLYSGDIIPAMRENDYLESGRLYFVLPSSKLRYPLTDSEIVELAVRASEALKSVPGKRRWWQRASQIAPEAVEKIDHWRSEKDFKKAERSYTEERDFRVVQKKRKTRRGSSLRHLRMVRESFRPTLSTIQEITE